MKTQQAAFRIAVASLCLAAASAFGATTFNFSFAFPEETDVWGWTRPALTVSGTLKGDRVGDFVTNVSEVSVFFNGTQPSQPQHGTEVYMARYAGRDADNRDIYAAEPVVSFTAENNNFVFSNNEIKPQQYFDWYFQIVNFTQEGGPTFHDAAAIQYGILTGFPANYGDVVVPERWSLTPVTPPLEFAGFLPPIGGADATGGSFVDPVRTFKLKSTIPVKFTASCDGAPVTSGVHTLQAVKWSDETNSDVAIDATPTDAATAGNQFRLTDGEWHFNLDIQATGMSTGKWQLIATLSDGTEHSVWIQIK